jgi:hypothetical protein
MDTAELVFYGVCLKLCKGGDMWIRGSVVQIEQFGCKEVEKMVGVSAVILYLLIAML